MSTTINKLQYSTFATLGISFLWPWNSLLSAVPYFSQRLADFPMLQRTISSNIMFISTLTSSILFIYFVFKRTKEGTDSTAVYSRRIILGELIIALAFLLLAVSCLLGTGVNQILYFIFVMIVIFVSTIGTALTQNGSFAVVNLFDPIYTQSIMVGQAIAGILPPVLYIWSQLGNKSSSGSSSSNNGSGSGGTEGNAGPEIGNGISSGSSFLSFIVSSLISVLALCLYNLLVQKMPERLPSLASFFSHGRTNIYSMVSLDQTVRAREPNNHPHSDEPEAEILAVPANNAISPFQLVYQRLRIPALNIFLTFSISLLFPVFLPVVKPINSNYDETVFSTFALFIWNFGDLLGRVVCGLEFFAAATPRSSKFYLSYAVARFGFIPLLFLCNINGKGALLNSDLWYILLQFLFGFTNGHLSTRIMMLASTINHDKSESPPGPDSETFLPSNSPDGEREKAEREAAGSFMTLAISLGLTCGSLFSFALVYII
jgi:equilibrative nucleoside transporter 1/2/3